MATIENPFSYIETDDISFKAQIQNEASPLQNRKGYSGIGGGFDGGLPMQTQQGVYDEQSYLESLKRQQERARRENELEKDWIFEYLCSPQTGNPISKQTTPKQEEKLCLCSEMIWK